MKNPYGFSFPGTTGEFRVHSRKMKSKETGAGGRQNPQAFYCRATAVGVHAQKLVFKRGITPCIPINPRKPIPIRINLMYNDL